MEKIIDKKTLISVEIMRFLYRHQSYSKLYYIFNPKKYDIDLKEISENKIFENLKSDEEFECSNKAFILINNFDKIKSYKYIRRPIYLLDNLQYLVMTKKEIIININEDKDYNESDRKYKNKILVKDSKYKVISKSLIPEKNNINEFNNIKMKNNLFENYNSIFEDSFESQKTWGSNNESND